MAQRRGGCKRFTFQLLEKCADEVDDVNEKVRRVAPHLKAPWPAITQSGLLAYRVFKFTRQAEILSPIIGCSLRVVVIATGRGCDNYMFVNQLFWTS